MAKADKKNKEENSEKSFAHAHFSWYPGHMVKAQNEIKNSLKLIDIVVEVLDARIPVSSRNNNINELVKDKKRIIVLNKYDLADKVEVTKWKNYFEENGNPCIFVNANVSENIANLVDEIRIQGKKIYDEKNKNKNIKINPIYRVLIVGIPNVGKSTIINKIAKRNAVVASNKPGVTRKNQWIRVGNDIELLDTPGLLMPNLSDNNAGEKLALTGNIKQEIIDIEELAYFGIKDLIEEGYFELLKIHYKLDDNDVNLEYYDILELIGKKRGCLRSGGNVDVERVSKLILDDIKNGKIGKVCLEKVRDML